MDENQTQVTEPTTEQAAPTTPERPQWLPEKFENPEALAAAYAALEKKLGAGTEVQPTAPEGEEQAPVVDVAEVVLKAGTTIAALTDEFFENDGKLTEKSYEQAAKFGMTREQVDAAVAAQVAVAEKDADALYALVGGRDEYNRMTQWAKGKLSEREKISFNAAVNNKDMGLLRLAISGLHSRYVAENGRAPKLVAGDTAASPSDTFTSRAQVVEAMKDPRYNKDPAYRANVERRLAGSKAIEIRQRG